MRDIPEWVTTNHAVSDVEDLTTATTVEYHRILGGSIISRLDNGAFVGLIYELLVFS